MTNPAGTLSQGPRFQRLAHAGRWKNLNTRVRRRSAFTLIELILVIAIIALLIQLLLPAVQSAREGARRSQCLNHLRQLGLAALQHEEAHGHLPTGGWGFSWVGNPNRGFGVDQPGGWAYNLLPFLEQQALHDLARDPKGQSREAITAQLCRTPVPLFYCPTRRPARCYAYVQFSTWPTRYCEPLTDAAKTDYAANGGDFFVDGPAGPADEAEASSYYRWIDPATMTGVVFQRSRVKMSQLTDGASQTYLFGEKYLDSAHYEDGFGGGDDQTAWCGYDQDTVRWTAYNGSDLPPLHDHQHYRDWATFGSAHPAGCLFTFCDGSAHLVTFAVDGEVHRRLGNRRDGQHSDLARIILGE